MNLIRIGRYNLALFDSDKALELEKNPSNWLVKAHALLGVVSIHDHAEGARVHAVQRQVGTTRGQGAIGAADLPGHPEALGRSGFDETSTQFGSQQRPAQAPEGNNLLRPH